MMSEIQSLSAPLITVTADNSITHLASTFSDASIVENIENVTNEASDIDNSASPDTSAPVEKKSWIKSALMFIKNLAPNQLILQAGPQIHNDLTGADFKFTPTFFLAPDHAEIYPFHHEIGCSLKTNTNFPKSYATVARQQGLHVDFRACPFRVGYLRQEFGRIDVEIPYGNTGLQFTLGLELGITDKTKDRSKALSHAIKDFSTSSAQALCTVLFKFLQHKSLISGLIGMLVAPEVLARLSSVDNERERTLWFGLSLGYADLNSQMHKIIDLPPDPQGFDINIQGNIYTRHSEVMLYKFENKELILPESLKAMLSLRYNNKKEVVSEILQNKIEIIHRTNKGEISRTASDRLLEVADALAVIATSVVNDVQGTVIVDIH